MEISAKKEEVAELLRNFEPLADFDEVSRNTVGLA